MASAEMALRWNQIWSVMEAWDRQSDSSALRERLLAAAPSPKRARLTAHAVTSSTATFVFTLSDTASSRPAPRATTWSPRIFSFSKLQAHTGAAIEEKCQPRAISFIGPNGSDEAKAEEERCRLCLEGIVDGPLVQPCACRGSAKLAHKHCLNKWRRESPKEDAAYRCGQCMDEYRDALSIVLLSARLQAERTDGQSIVFTLDKLAKRAA